MEGGSFQSRICLERLCTIYLRCESTALSLVQDASCGWLCLRYSGSNSSLRRCVGVLGVFPLAELGQVHAYKVAHATRRIIEEFATPTRTMPYSKQGRFLGLFFYVWESFQEGLTVWSGVHLWKREVLYATGGVQLGDWNRPEAPLQKGDPKNPWPHWSSHCRCSSWWTACVSCWSKIWDQGFLSVGTG